jgi:hypothetical protein
MRQHWEGLLWLTALVSFLLAGMISARGPLILLGILSMGSMAVVIPLHFFRAWRRVGSVPNRREYVVWIGFETLFAVALVGGFIWMVTAH